MLRKTTITLIAAASLGVATLAPDTASAQRGMRSGMGGVHAGMAGGVRGHAFAPRFAVHNRVAVNHLVFRNRFAVRHHFPFRHRFAFAAAVPFAVGSSCLVWWHGRQVWICDDDY
jgi:uncharacterized protein (DUF1684 family)